MKGVPHGERLSVACFDDLEDARSNFPNVADARD
jgi:hypothetical protein